MESWLQNNYLEIWSTHNEWKSVVAERLIGTTSFSTSLLKNTYIDILANIENVYNNIHDSIVKMKLADVKSSTNARKTIFSFLKCFEKMVFRKKLHWNMIFLVLSGNMIFIFPKNTILFFRHKRKDDLSPKNTCKYDIFSKCSEKMVFPRNPHLNTIIFVTSGKMVFLVSRKYGIFSLGGKWKKMIFIKERWKYGIFCIYA